MQDVAHHGHSFRLVGRERVTQLQQFTHKVRRRRRRGRPERLDAYYAYRARRGANTLVRMLQAQSTSLRAAVSWLYVTPHCAFSVLAD